MGQPSCRGWPGGVFFWLCFCSDPQKEIEISTRTNATPERNPWTYRVPNVLLQCQKKKKRGYWHSLLELRVAGGQAALQEGLHNALHSSSAALGSKG